MLRALRKKLQRFENSPDSVRSPLENQLIFRPKSVPLFLHDLSSFCYVTFDARSLRLFNLFLIGQKFWKDPNLNFLFLYRGITLLHFCILNTTMK